MPGTKGWRDRAISASSASPVTAASTRVRSVLFHLRDKRLRAERGSPRRRPVGGCQCRQPRRDLHHVVGFEKRHARSVARVHYHVRWPPGAEACDDLEGHSFVASDLGSSQRGGAVGGANRARLGLVVFPLGVGAHVGVAAHPQEQRVGRPGILYVAFLERPRDPPEELLVEALDVLAPAGTGACHARYVEARRGS